MTIWNLHVLPICPEVQACDTLPQMAGGLIGRLQVHMWVLRNKPENEAGSHHLLTKRMGKPSLGVSAAGKGVLERWKHARAYPLQFRLYPLTSKVCGGGVARLIYRYHSRSYELGPLQAVALLYNFSPLEDKMQFVQLSKCMRGVIASEGGGGGNAG